MSIETVGRYQLLKRLAMGGMAQIYLAREQGTDRAGRLAVVKRILPHLAENEDFVKMFLDEARIAARIIHPNVVEIFDLGVDRDSFFIAMEYIHGEDVRRVWKRSESLGQPPPVPLACRILIGACAGLDYAHKTTDANGRPLGIVHRDVSPQNILVTFEGGVKVVDFGIAKAADQATITRSGVLKGKYSYMSPEQAAGQRVDRRSDVFALGVVLYELVTGARLFKRPNDIQTLSAVAECNVLPASQVAPRVPADLDPILLKALAKDPAARYQEAAHLQQALEDWLSRQSQPSSTEHLGAFMKEIYAERLAAEARAGEVLLDDEPVGTGRRSALRPAIIRATGSAESETAALRPKQPGSKVLRLEPEPERPATSRATGARRALEPAPVERVSRAGLEAVPPLARTQTLDEDAPTVDGRAVSRATLTDVQLTTDPGGDDEDAPTLALLSDSRGGSNAVVRGAEEEAPTVSLPDQKSSFVVLPLSKVDEDAPTLSLMDARSPRPSVNPPRPEAGVREAPTPQGRVSRSGMAPAAPEPGGASRKGMWIGLAAVGVLLLGALLWSSANPPPPPLATVRMETVPPGASVTFNGGVLPDRTPLKLPPVPAGTYPVVVSMAGYEDLRLKVEVPATGNVSAGLLRLVAKASSAPPTTVSPPAVTPPAPTPTPPVAPSQVRLSLESSSPKAVVFVDGKRQGVAPVALSLAPGTEVAVRVEAAKHQTLERKVTVGSGAEQVERFDLVPEAKAVKAPVPDPGKVATSRETRKAPVRFVVTGATQWADVYCNGELIGQVPFAPVPMTVGRYQCRFTNSDLGRSINKNVVVSADAPNLVTVKF